MSVPTFGLDKHGKRSVAFGDCACELRVVDSQSVELRWEDADGEPCESVPAAIYCFLANLDSFEDAVVQAVNLGGDTDTIGAMTGALSGAYRGKTGIPKRWLESLENGPKGRDYIERLGDQLWEMRSGG